MPGWIKKGRGYSIKMSLALIFLADLYYFWIWFRETITGYRVADASSWLSSWGALIFIL